jgi:hypothetical protein
MRPLSPLTAAFLIAVSMTVSLYASVPTAVPEIDGATLTTGLALLAAGTLLIRARMRRK